MASLRTLSLACALVGVSVVTTQARVRPVETVPVFDRHAVNPGSYEIKIGKSFRERRRVSRKQHPARPRIVRLHKSQDRVAASVPAPVKIASIDPQDDPAPASSNILDRYRESMPSAPVLPPVEAKRHGLVTLRTQSGQTYNVAAGAARAFSGFVTWLESKGYKITEIGGYAFRRIAGSRTISNHARGTAIDINQRARNVVSRRLPADVTAKAAEFGLRHGAIWNDPDTGHFELMTSWKFAVLGSGKVKHRHQRRVRYAQAR